MHCIVTGMYSYLSEINSEIYIILDAHPLDAVVTLTRIWGSVVIFQSQKDPQAKSFRSTGL